MSQMQIADTIQTEIAGIDKAQTEMKASKSNLRDFILSDELLKDHRKFNELLSKWTDNLMSLVEATGTPFPTEPLQQTAKNPLGEGIITQAEGMDLTLAKAIVLIIVNIAIVVLTIQMYHPVFDVETGQITGYAFGIPWIVPVITVFASIALCFFQQIANFIRDLAKKEKELPQSSNVLTNKIRESISYIRNEYVKRRFLLKFQDTPHKNPIIDDALVNREAQTLEEMPSDFLSRIDDISVECNDAAFNRKKVLYFYLRTYQPQPSQPMPVPT
jgi:hypothetical protein